MLKKWKYSNKNSTESTTEPTIAIKRQVAESSTNSLNSREIFSFLIITLKTFAERWKVFSPCKASEAEETKKPGIIASRKNPKPFRPLIEHKVVKDRPIPKPLNIVTSGVSPLPHGQNPSKNIATKNINIGAKLQLNTPK